MLCNGWVHEGSTIVESSSGSTAVSEAYFARLLGLPFVGNVSDRYPTYVVPAGYAFSIWSVIFALSLAYAVWQALPAQRAKEHAGHEHTPHEIPWKKQARAGCPVHKRN